MARVILCILVFGTDVILLVRWLKKLEYRKLAVIGEAGDGGEDRIIPLIAFLAFVGNLLVLGG